MNEVSHPGVQERIDAASNMWVTYPNIMSLLALAALAWIVISEHKKENKNTVSILRMIIYSIVFLVVLVRLLMQL